MACSVAPSPRDGSADAPSASPEAGDAHVCHAETACDVPGTGPAQMRIDVVAELDGAPQRYERAVLSSSSALTSYAVVELLPAVGACAVPRVSFAVRDGSASAPGSYEALVGVLLDGDDVPYVVATGTIEVLSYDAGIWRARLAVDDPRISLDAEIAVAPCMDASGA